MKKLLAPIFSTNMVLQRRKPLPFWGYTSPCDTVTISFNGFSATTTANEEGYWSVTAPPMEAETDLVLIVCDSKERLKYTGIALGEVWLAGGQSNMEFSLSQSTEWEEFQIPANRNPKVRFFYTPKVPYRNALYESQWANVGWQTIESRGFADWSSVGYQFAAELADELHVTVGVIGCNWGGTSASAWMDREHILAAKETEIYITEFEEGIKGQTLEEQYEAYDAYEKENDEWNRRCNELYAENPLIEWDEVNRILGECKWPGPKNLGNPFRPCGLFDQMVCEISPYTLGGVLFYQGESDDHRPNAYRTLFGNMIRNWRELWKDNELPFIFTQLPMHRYKADPDFKHWPLIREAQLQTFEEVKNTGIAIIPDCGEWNEIHPKSKKKVAHRLALQALFHIYEKCPAKKAMAPIYDYKVLREHALEIHFKYADGLVLDGAPVCYEVAGTDRIYHPATVTLLGKDAILLESPEAGKPIYGRYLWSNYALPSLYGKNGLPASPFRTDSTDSAERTGENMVQIQQIMET